jgi:hypothetical protein
VVVFNLALGVLFLFFDAAQKAESNFAIRQ